MKFTSACLLFTGLAAAHSAVRNITFDGTNYPARDGRMDDQLNAKRIEWYRDETQPGNPWASVNDVQSDAIACEDSSSVAKSHANDILTRRSQCAGGKTKCRRASRLRGSCSLVFDDQNA